MLFLIVTSIIWSLSFGLIKSQLTGLDPFLVAFLRLGISFLAFLPFLKRLPFSLAGRLMALGAIQFGLMYCLYIASYAYLSGAEVALLTITSPLFVIAWYSLFQRKLQPGLWLAAGLAVLAASILVWDQENLTSHLRGVLYLQGANALFALGQVLYKKHAPPGPAHKHFGYLYLGALCVPFIFLSASGQFPSLPQNTNTWLALIYLGVIASGLGFFLWNQGIRQVGHGMIAVMNNLKIPLGALIAWALFGEHLDLWRWLPAALLFALAFLPLKNARNAA